MNDEKSKDKISDENRETANKVIEETIKWLQVNKEEIKEKYEDKRKEVEQICKPIMDEMSKGMGMPEAEEKVTNSEPNIDDVD